MNSACRFGKPNGMLFAIVLCTLFLVFIQTSSNTYGRDLYSPNSLKPYGDKMTAGRCWGGLIHNVGRIGLAVSNNGCTGLGSLVYNEFDDLPPSCQYPYPSKYEYLFQGALWVGAIVGEDTLVSVGNDGWHMMREMWPDSCPDGAMRELSICKGDSGAVSEQDFIAVYTDTVTTPNYVIDDPFDGRPHIPLNIEVTQKSHAWSNPEADDFVIFEFWVKNIGMNILEDVYIGYYVDGDVTYEYVYGDYTDDVSGLKGTVNIPLGCGFEDSVFLPWIADNDGKNQQTDPCPYNSRAHTSVTGIYLLRTPHESVTVNFNWWTTDLDPFYDFGPRLAGTPEDPFRDFGGFLGTPEGDRNKYYIMSHPEIDYDQLFTSVDHSSEGWLAPPPYSDNLADGTDTRYLLSFGPVNIAPGDSVSFAFAYVAGENFHTNCQAFTNLFDPYSPQEFADQLNFDEFVTNALQAKWLYDIPGYDTDSDGYAGKYYLCGVGPDQDTIYYEGDGVPDLKVPRISPYRKSLRLSLENGVDVRVRWNGLVPETRLDYTLGFNDFEGYKISHSIPGSILYAQVAGYDREDYLKMIWSNAHQRWEFPPNVLTETDIFTLYGISDISQFSVPDTALAFHWLDSIFHFAPACENNSDLTDSLMIHKLYPMQPYPSTLNVDSLYTYYPDELTSDGFLKYFEYEYIIRGLEPGTEYKIKLANFESDRCFSSIREMAEMDTIQTMPATDIPSDGDGILAENFRIHQNYPNPFNPRTEIQFDLPRKENVTITIYNLLGQMVKKFELGEKPSGSHTVIWDGTDDYGRAVATGIYLYRITAGDFTGAKKMVLLK